MKLRKRVGLRFLAISIITALTLVLSGYGILIHQFRSIKASSLDQMPGHVIWAHGGFIRAYPANSIEGFDAAGRMGYYGIELDINFIEGKGLIVSHDIPSKEADDKDCLFLDTVFSRYRAHFYYWLDFKNLDSRNAEKAGKILSEYIQSYALEGHVFVESQRAWPLRKLKKAVPQINTIYWLHGHLNHRFTLLKTKYYVILSGADTVSIPVKYADDTFLKNFSHLNKAVFTVNDSAVVEYLFKKGVRIILTDLDMREQFPFAYR